jgi:hypothetical protein
VVLRAEWKEERKESVNLNIENENYLISTAE